MKSYICGCVKNCGPYLIDVFHNIAKIIELLEDYHIFIAFDYGNDNSLNLLDHFQRIYKKKMNIFINKNHISNKMTENLANARNQLLKMVNQHQSDIDHLIMLDMDDVCAKPIRISVLKEVIDNKLSDPWDILSFYREPYYDVWALSLAPYYFSCWNFPKPQEVLGKYRNYLKSKITNLKKDSLLPVFSAFSGFAIYKLKAIENCHYEWSIFSSAQLLGKDKLEETSKALNKPLVRNKQDQDCEHRFFHLSAIQKNNAQIKMSPQILFS